VNLSWLKKPLPAALTLVLLWTICRLAILVHTGIPQPGLHDEFSYLLGADTFAHGRLANPPPVLGKFFESPHILVRPVYVSKYPPGQALFLALGQRVFGSPFYGVLIGNALMLFTLCLMLYAWVTPRWALAVSVMFALAFTPAMYWTNSYWGGSVATSGGALVLLAIGIYRRRQTPLAGVVFALGALLLFWTRPFEGGVFTILMLLIFARELWRMLRPGVLVAACSVLAIGGAWTGIYNKAITGSPLHLPYLLHDHMYNTTPVFWFLPMRTEPVYDQPRLAGQHGNNGREAIEYKELGQGPLRPWRAFTATLWYMGLTLGVAVLFTLLVPVAWRDPLYRKMAIVAGFFILAMSAETFQSQHYFAPVWAGLGLMIAVWAEHAWNLRIRNWRVGRPLVVLALLSPALITPLPHLLRPLTTAHALAAGTIKAPPDLHWPRRRKALIDELSHLDRDQLVIVRYPWLRWRVEEEWVYNGADIDHQRVIFAHDFGPDENRALLDHYPDRSVVLLTFDPDTGQEKIEPYSTAADAQ
jgi:hypothetical protein